MKNKVIWSNYDIDINDYEDYLAEEYPQVIDDDDKYKLCCELNDEYFQDEKMNLDIELPTDILIIADLGFWNGRINGYKELNKNNIKDCFAFECDCAYAEWYIDKYKNLRSNQTHHDNTHRFLYRRWKENVTANQKCTFLNALCYGDVRSADITKYTKSIGNEICKVYGWS